MVLNDDYSGLPAGAASDKSAPYNEPDISPDDCCFICEKPYHQCICDKSDDEKIT